MAIVLEANYSKKLGLPGYSSHQYSVTIKTEVTDPAQVAAESGRLYDLLQGCVDTSIQKIGFLPEAASGNGNGRPANGNNGNGRNEHWACSPKQRLYSLWTSRMKKRRSGRAVTICCSNSVTALDLPTPVVPRTAKCLLTISSTSSRAAMVLSCCRWPTSIMRESLL